MEEGEREQAEANGWTEGERAGGRGRAGKGRRRRGTRGTGTSRSSPPPEDVIRGGSHGYGLTATADGAGVTGGGNDRGR